MPNLLYINFGIVCAFKKCMSKTPTTKEDKMEKLSKSKFEWVVYAAYAYGDKDQGEIISRHRTYEAAEKKARQSTFWGVMDAREVEE